LAYSGGLDTSTILVWLIEQGYEVYAYIADVGQKEDYAAVEAKALKLGAKKFFCEDLKNEFVTEFIWTWLKSNATYDGRYLLGTALARPCIARRQALIAEREGCDFVSHGATGKGNDQVRFELGVYACAPQIKVLAPWREKSFLERFKGRPDLLEYAKANGIEVSATPSSPYSEDENLFHVSHESGILEDPDVPAPESVYSWTASPEEAAKLKPELLDIEFRDGVPVRVANKQDGTEKTDPVELFAYLNEVGGRHGIGRLDMVENRFIGVKSRGIYENPAASILLEAHRDIEGVAMDREVLRLRDMLAVKFAEFVYNGFWFSPEMEFLLAALNKASDAIDGVVTVRLFAGVVYPIARASPTSLYDKDLVSFDVEGGFVPNESTGFIKINSIRLKAHHYIMQQRKPAASSSSSE
jgi:argininosuccinate synthase